MELYIVYWNDSWRIPQVRTVHTDPVLAEEECEELREEFPLHNWRWRAIKAGETIL